MKANLLATTAALVVTLAAISPAYCESLNIKILLQADNGLYLSRIHRGGKDPIEAAKVEPDVNCQFLLFWNHEDDTYSFQADNGLYLSRIHRGGVDAIEAAKASIDASSKFNVISDHIGKISLQANNDMWLSRINRGDRDPVEAAKSSLDQSSEFTVSVA